MPSSPCKLDDIVLGRDFAILAAGERRILIEALSSAERKQLEAARQQGSFADDLLEERIEAAMQRFAPAQTRGAVVLRISSRRMTVVAAPLQVLASRRALAWIGAGSASVHAGCLFLMVAFGRPDLAWPSSVLATALTLSILVGLSCFVHELGHAAACLHATGATGGLRFRSRGRGISLLIDVSCQAVAPPAARRDIALAGLIFQSGYSAIMLLAGTIANVGVLSAASGVTVCLITANMIPHGTNDGAQYLAARNDRANSAPSFLNRWAPLLRAIRSVAIVTGGGIVTVTLWLQR